MLILIALATLPALVAVAALTGMVAVLVAVSLWSDWRDGVRA